MRRRILIPLLALATLFAVPDAMAAAKLRVLHAAPDVPAVDVYVNGTKAVSGLGTLAATDYLKLRAGTYNVSVTLAGAPEAAAPLRARITLHDRMRYTALARGLIGKGTAELALQQDIARAYPWFSALRVWHLSPDAPNVDVYVFGIRVLSNVPYKAASGYLPLPPGSYPVKINVAGTTTTVFSARLRLRSGRAYTAAALGSVTGAGAAFTVSLLEDAKRGWGWGDDERDDD